TSSGDRVLEGKERSLVVHAAACLLDHLLEEAGDADREEEFAWHTGVALFDRLGPEERIALLRDVVRALTDPAGPTPGLTAANEAAVHAVFRFVRGEVELEIDTAGCRPARGSGLDELSSLLGYDPLYWRKMVLAAYLEGRGPADADAGAGEE